MFILIAAKANILLPTIVSRCQQLSIAEPKPSVVTTWLQQEVGQEVPPFASHINGNAPVKTKTFIEEGGLEQYKDIEKAFISALQGDIAAAMHCVKKLNEAPAIRLTWLWYLLTDAQKVHFGIENRSFTPGCHTLSAQLSYVVLEQQSLSLATLIEKVRQFPGLNTELLITDWIFNFNEEACL